MIRMPRSHKARSKTERSSPADEISKINGSGRADTVGLNAALVDSVQSFAGMADPNTLIGVAVSVDPVTYAETSMIDLLSTSDGSTTSQVLLPPGAVFGGSFEQPPSFRCAPAAGVCAFPVLEEDSSGFILSGALQVWALDGTLVQSIDMAGGDVAISPDGQYVASVNDGDVIVYRVSDGSQVKTLLYRNQIL